MPCGCDDNPCGQPTPVEGVPGAETTALITTEVNDYTAEQRALGNSLLGQQWILTSHPAFNPPMRRKADR